VSGPRAHRPGQFELGGACPHCSESLEAAVRVVSCPRCGISQHESCWAHHGGCGSYHCIQGARFDARGVRPDVVVTDEDLAAPPPAVPAPAPGPFRRPAPDAERTVPERTSRLALWSFGLGLAGVLLAGCPGVVATVLGGLALSRIGASRGKLGGAGWAATGIVLGLLSTVGWLTAAALWFDRRESPFLEDDDREVRLEGLPDPIAAALRQNVKIEGTGGAARFLGTRRWGGSGVILAVREGRVLVVTNRHVALGEEGGSAEGKGPRIRLRFVDGSIVPASLLWLAPGKVDLALLECEAPPGVVAAARFASGPGPRVGDALFAVGNPHGLGWTYTRGVLSAFTTKRSEEGRSVAVIQTQTPISPGSSGGGLYDESGALVGINTWTMSGSGAEGIHFAISAADLAALLRESGQRLE